MAGLLALSLLAAQFAGASAPSAGTSPSARVAVSAPASVRILSGAKVNLGSGPQPEGYKPTRSIVTLEDGRRSPAQLVEFQ